MIMKISFYIFLIVFSFSLESQYPKGQSPEHRATSMVNLLKSVLSLTDQQTEKVRQIYVTQYKSRDSLTKIIVNRGPNPATINSKLSPMIRANELETNKKISSVLDNNQKLAFSKFVSSRKSGIMSVRSTPPK
jgi:hypothetical protein